MYFADKSVWITGASSGIGAALAVELAGRGARLILSARREERLQEVAGNCRSKGVEAHILPLDLADTSSLPQKAQAAQALSGPIDILINNAGLGQRSPALDTDPSVVERIMQINFLSQIILTQAVLPTMIARKDGQVVITSSILGKFGAPRRSAYCASKAALHGYFDALRAEIHGHGIAVTLVCPGFVRTEISQHALEGGGREHRKLDPGQERGMATDKFAAKMAAAIARRKEEVFIGGWETMAVHAKRFFPGVFSRIIRKVKMD